MAFTMKCMAAELARALTLANQVAGREKQVAILSASRIVVRDGTATISATNMDHSIIVDIAAEGEGEIFATTSLMLQKAVALRGNQPVEIITDAELPHVNITQGRTKWRMPTVPGNAFPSDFVSPIPGDAVTIRTAVLFPAMAAAMANVNPNDDRIFGKGIFFDMRDGFTVVSASGSGMSATKIDAPALPVEIIMPNDSVSAMASIMRDAVEIDVVANSDGMTIAADGVMYRTKLVDGTYPEWRKAHAANTKDHSRHVVVDREELMATVKRATAIGEDKVKNTSAASVKVVIDGSELSVSTRNKNGEEGSDYCSIQGDEGWFGVATNKLLVALGTFSDQFLRIDFGDVGERSTAILIQPDPVDGTDYRIIMPMLMN